MSTRILCIILFGLFFSCKSLEKEPEVIIEPIADRLNALLVHPSPSPEAKAVYDFLRENYGKQILSGVMTLNSFDEVKWLKENTGKEPAIVGLDFMHNNRDYSWFDEHQPIKDAKTYWDRNGLPALMWHWRDPSKKTEAFYTSDTAFDVSKITDPDSEEYKAIIRDIDYISGLLKILQQQKVPVLWRPLHEAAGAWFWWGAKGPESCKKLYQIMYDRMVNQHGLNNLIWIWTYEKDESLWYPGDSCVDIVGRDIYKQGDRSSQVEEYTKVSNHHKSSKIVALTECGTIPDVAHLKADKANWSWFMTWYGDFVRNEKHNTLTSWKFAMNSSYVITLDEMPSLKK